MNNGIGTTSALAGTLLVSDSLVKVPQLITEYFAFQPDVECKAQHVSFGTSGHRGSSLEQSFNEWHVLAICQAICHYRAKQAWSGPLFLGADTHALSSAAFASAMEVLAANGVDVMISPKHEPTPTPAVSLAILTFNQGRNHGLADGIVITSSHNPPDSGGIKYNPPHGGAANCEVTTWIQDHANELMLRALQGVKRVSYQTALNAATTHAYNYLEKYVRALPQVIDLKLISEAGVRLAIDPLGGAGVHYWSRIANEFDLDLSVLNTDLDPTFRFVLADWDGAIRMDPSSSFVMQNLLSKKNQYDILGACDTDHDRHGVVTPLGGLIPSNQFLLVAINYLFQHRPAWKPTLGIGKTMVTSQSIDRLAAQLNRPIFETPAGFKWFAEGLQKSSLGFCGEESAGATFLRKDGGVWTSDKDGLIPILLAAEIKAKTGDDPAHIYQLLCTSLGTSFYQREEMPASVAQKTKLKEITPQSVAACDLAGEKIIEIATRAKGNGQCLGGVKVSTKNAWFAIRPSGTEALVKIYAESFIGEQHLQTVLAEAKIMLNDAVSAK